MQNPQDFLNPTGNQNNLDEIWQFLYMLRHNVDLTMIDIDHIRNTMGCMTYSMVFLHKNIHEVNNNLNTVANAARAYTANHN
jgi:hypothetical protein